MFTGISEYMCARIRAYAYGFAYSAGDRTLAAAFRAADRLNEWENGPREGRKEGRKLGSMHGALQPAYLCLTNGRLDVRGSGIISMCSAPI